ncbi:hypothetical protein AB0A77_05825 [Streptomyces varsoviensis]|uniref:hypothetical protein n=1 Tax=Streptomyces varsoviensis TaxID=67373 RepID=UPI0033EBDC55
MRARTDQPHGSAPAVRATRASRPRARTAARALARTAAQVRVRTGVRAARGGVGLAR